jgi:hypothetical protein
VIAETVPAEKRAQSFLQVGIFGWLKDACGAFSTYRLETRAALSAFTAEDSRGAFSSPAPFEDSLDTFWR